MALRMAIGNAQTPSRHKLASAHPRALSSVPELDLQVVRCGKEARKGGMDFEIPDVVTGVRGSGKLIRLVLT